MNQPTLTDTQQPLRSIILLYTGSDPVVEPEFNWSETTPCAECGGAGPTADCIFDDAGEYVERVCYECFMEKS